MPQWRIGDRVRWHDKAGLFHRDLGDGNAEVTIANRVSGEGRGSQAGVMAEQGPAVNAVNQ